MKALTMTLLLALSLATISCGKNNRSSGNNTTYRNAYTATYYARDVYEVNFILQEAAMRRTLRVYHNARWLDHNGFFIARSVVLNPMTYRLLAR